MKIEVAAINLCMWTVTLLQVSSPQAVFIEEPGPGPVLLPVGGHIIFNCSVSPGHTLIGWRVYVPDVKLEYLTDSTRNSESLALIGITVRMIGSLSTQLLVNATRENLLTYALCEARLGSNDSTLTRSRVDVTVYGPPKTPTNLSLRVKDDFLTVSWFSSTIPNVSLTFDLVLINTRTSSRKEVTIYDSMQHQFSVEDVQACDVLEVLVTGSNDAGVGNCEALKVSFPALPNINTIQHLLSKTSRDRVKLTVTFMIPMQCPISLVTNYTLEVVLEDSGQNMTEQSTTISSTSPDVSLEVEDLMEKEAYTYSIVAINAIGRATTSSTSFLTTDVQGVSVCVVEGSTYSVQCSHIAGSSNTSGCSYVLVGVVEDTRNINGSIHMSSTVNEDVPNIKDYGRILVYDEGNVLVMNGTLENIGSCPMAVNKSITTIYTIIGLLLGAAMIILATILIIMFFIVRGCRRKRDEYS